MNGVAFLTATPAAEPPGATGRAKDRMVWRRDPFPQGRAIYKTGLACPQPVDKGACLTQAPEGGNVFTPFVPTDKEGEPLQAFHFATAPANQLGVLPLDHL